MVQVYLFFFYLFLTLDILGNCQWINGVARISDTMPITRQTVLEYNVTCLNKLNVILYSSGLFVCLDSLRWTKMIQQFHLSCLLQCMCLLLVSVSFRTRSHRNLYARKSPYLDIKIACPFRTIEIRVIISYTNESNASHVTC